ncbi:hypothetical protein DPMN_019858 [Dreissena polymorpha]|uniref:Uncharacterized protein n=1 Tax=Dreissena polymorpha TaxID=45954 RepID=A0A9D4S9P1_DREPO|nr:hypothetical protein DPMN_019858 [Dreissena polymorpha]
MTSVSGLASSLHMALLQQQQQQQEQQLNNRLSGQLDPDTQGHFLAKYRGANAQ